MIVVLAWSPAPANGQGNVSRPVNQSRLPDDDSAQSSDADQASSSQASSSSSSETDGDEEEDDEETSHTSSTTAASGDATDEAGEPDRPDAGEAADPAASEEGAEPIEASNPVDYCNQFMVPYLESSARKLYRALAGRDYGFQPLNLQDWIELEVRRPNGDSRTVEFEVFREKDGKVAGLIDSERQYRRTLVVAMLESGPVIASYRWPTTDAIAERGDCRPADSRLEYPIVPADDIDPEPFKFWGLRVVWRLPKSFDRGDQDRENLYQTIAEILKSERNATD